MPVQADPSTHLHPQRDRGLSLLTCISKKPKAPKTGALEEEAPQRRQTKKTGLEAQPLLRRAYEDLIHVYDTIEYRCKGFPRDTDS